MRRFHIDVRTALQSPIYFSTIYGDVQVFSQIIGIVEKTDY